jgi:serine/threonine-protein kinase
MSVSFAEGLVGFTLDERYRLDAVLGEGGMGAVFRATHLAMDRKVAVKLLKPHLSNNEASLERFKREARSTMKVDSPHAVKVLDYGITPLRDYYMVLEYLDGRTVQRELDVDGVFAPTRVVHIARQALHALGAAHAIGIVHRDIKPENILLMRVGTDADYTKLLDFGVAKLMEGAAKSSQSALALTQAGTVFGTPEFMSPEQACGHPLDGRSDLYSLAGTMFAMLTGCGMFDANNAIEWLTNHVRTPPPHLADVAPELASYPELDELLQACLAKQRDKRPASAAEMDRLLHKIEPTLSRAPGATPGTSKVKVFSTSMFFEPLPLDTVDPGATLLPSAGMSLEQIEAAAPSVETAPLRSRRGIYFGIGALVVLGVISVAIGVMMSKKRGEAPPDAAIARPSPDAGSVAVAIDAAAAIDAIALVDAAVTPADAAIDAPTRPTGGSSERPKNTVALRHLAEAEAAFGAKAHPVVQMAAAQLALESDPQSLLRPDQRLRARFLFGDALLRTDGNFEKGCAYLRALRNIVAINQAKARGCPN